VPPLRFVSSITLKAGLPRTGASGVAKAGARRRFSNLGPQRLCHQAAQIDVRRSVREPHFDADANILGTIRVA
jgi:nucleoside-diphosphate-sugar epimerase